MVFSVFSASFLFFFRRLLSWDFPGLRLDRRVAGSEKIETVFLGLRQFLLCRRVNIDLLVSQRNARFIVLDAAVRNFVDGLGFCAGGSAVEQYWFLVSST